MEHPLIGDLNGLTLDEISTKVTELNKKLRIATSSGNGHLCHQLRMALESYNAKYQEKLKETHDQSGRNFADKINIS
jgi:hypothetical protein